MITCQKILRVVLVLLPLEILGPLRTEVTAGAPPDFRLAASPTQVETAETTLEFSFRFAPWQGVLEWLANESKLSLQLDVVPPGTFNYVDSRPRTPTEAIDIANRALLTKGYTLVRVDKLLTVIDLKDESAARVLSEMLPVAVPADLQHRGKFELTKCKFELSHTSPSHVEEQIRPLLGPQGSILVIPAVRQVIVVETGSKLRIIERVIDAMDRKSKERRPLRLRSHPTAPADPTRALEVLQTLLAGQPDIRLAIDPKTSGLIALATETQHARIEATLKELRQVGPRKSPIRVVPHSNTDIEDLIATLQSVWSRKNAIRFAPSTPLRPLREVTPSRMRAHEGASDRREPLERPLREEFNGRSRNKPSSNERTEHKAEEKGRVLLAPRGPVRIVHIEGTDLLLIRAGAN